VSDFDDASLVLIPSGYKNGKVYSVKPTDGTGDLTFTRASSATRVQSNGLIEKVRTNLLLNSATFVTQTVTVTGNPHTISFTGTGTVVITGTGSGTLVGTGAANRVSLSFTATAGALILTGTGTVTLAQLETGDIATDYIPTTATAVSVGPVSGLPRLDYYDSACPKLLLEPQRSNLALYSENFDNAGWTKTNTTITANASISPDGYVNADKLIANSGAVLSSISNNALQAITKAASAIQYTYSVFAKQSGLNRISIFAQGTSAANHAIVTISLVNGTISTAAATGGTFTGASASVSDYGNGWYRCALVFTTNTDTALTFRNIPTDSTITTGDGVTGILIYGAQLEQAPYASSYIPTLGASVTRVADAASKTGITSLIGQTEGTLFYEFNSGANDSADYVISLSDGTTSNRIFLFRGAANNIMGRITASGTVNASISSSTLAENTTYKAALAYANNDVVLNLNGIQVGVDTSATIPATDRLLFDNGAGAGVARFFRPLNQLLLFKTRLTNAQLAELTA
jgi:hypothetical protein